MVNTRRSAEPKRKNSKGDGTSYNPLARDSQRLAREVKKAAKARATVGVSPGNSIVGSDILVTKTWYSCAELADIVSYAV